MDYQPLVSICIPVYNAVKYIEDTINNFLNQTYQNLEIIIQDDKSRDGTWELMNTLFGANTKVSLAQNEKNLGIGPNWNAVYERAKGELIVIANADDIHYPQFISKAVRNLYCYKADFVTFKYEIFNESTNLANYTNENAKLTSGIRLEAYREIFFINPFHIVFTLFKKECIDKVKVNNKAFLDTQVCDFELMLRYSLSNALYFDGECMGRYRIHTTNNSGIPLAEIKSFYRDVVPYWHSVLSKKLGVSYRKLHLKNFKNYSKALLKGKVPFNLFVIKSCLRFAVY